MRGRSHRRLIINCRWLSGPQTGTQRYASEITRQLADQDPQAIELLVPSEVQVPEWAQELPIRRLRIRSALAEQVLIPLTTMGRTVLSMAGPGLVLKRRQIAVLHDATPFRFPQTFTTSFILWYRVMFWVVLHVARHVITVSEFSRSELISIFGTVATKVHVIPCGSDHIDRLSAREPDASLQLADDRSFESFILMVSTLARHKNLVPTATALLKAGIPVLVVGASGKEGVFSELSGLADIPPNFLLGRVSDAELKWLYQHARALVFPSLYEGFGLPVVEAQRSGCPVLVAAAGSLPEVAGPHGVSALWFDPNSPEQAARIIADGQLDALTPSLIANGKANAARFNWHDSAEAFFRLYRKGTL